MKTMRFVMWVSLCLALTLVLAACTAVPAAPGAGAEQPAAASNEIVVWSRYDLDDPNDSNGAVLKEFITNLEASEGVKVIHEQVAWDQLATKLALAVQSGGDVPDLVETSSQHVPALLDAGALSPLGEWLKDEAWAQDLTDGDKKACVFEGERYCVANNVRGGMTYYKAELFPNGFPTSPDEAMAACEALKADGLYLNTFFAGRSYGAIEINWWPLIKSNGGSIFDAEGKPAWTSDQVVEVAKWAQSMFKNGCFPQVALTGDFADSQIVWTDGQSAAFGGGSWSPNFVEGLLDQVNSGQVAMQGGLPFNGTPHVFMVSEGWVVPTGAKNPQGAVAFLRAFMQPEFLAKWAEAQFGIPTTNAAYAVGKFQGSPFYENVDTILGEQGAYMEPSPYYVESLDILATTWQELMLNPDRDPAPALQQAADEVLGRYWQ